MKITWFSHFFSPEIGAPSARINDLSRQWLAQGHEVEVVTCYPNHPTGVLYQGYQAGWAMNEVIDGIQVHRNWTYVTPNKGFFKRTLGHLSFVLGSLCISGPRLKTTDVVIGTSPTLFAALAAALFARWRKIPFIMEVRDLWPAIFVELGILKNRFIIGMLERWEMAMYRQATRVVTVTESFRRNLIERGVPPEKVMTIFNGADVDFWIPRRRPDDLARRLGLTENFVVLYIGAHGISQALGRVLDAAQGLRDHPSIRFVLVGEGAEKEELKARASVEGLGNIIFLDPVDKTGVRDFYALADVCLVPLRNIPLFDHFIPSKMFEIMAMARPIIGSLQGEAAEILTASGGALIVPPEDGSALAQAILRLYEDSSLGPELGARGRHFVTEHFSRQALAGRYAQALAEAMAEVKEGE